MTSVAMVAALVIATLARGAPQPASEAGVRALLDAGRYPDAEKAAQALVEARETTATTAPLALADGIDLLLESRRRANRASTPGTIDLGKRALGLREASLEPTHPAIAATLHELGYILRLSRRTKEARPLVERALAIREAAFGADSIEAATTRQLLAMTDLDVRDFATAERRLRTVLEVAERLQGPHGALVASTCHFLGVAASFRSDFEASIRWLRRAIDILEQIHGPEFPDLAASVERLASSTEGLGDLATARQHFERAIALSARTSPSPSQAQLFRLLQFSVLLGNLGETRAALARSDEAVAMAERLQGPDSSGVAIALGVAAATRHSLGDFAGARARIERALAIWRRSGASGQHVGDALGSLAALDESEGRLDAALSTTTEALKAFEGMEGDTRLKTLVLETRGRVLTALARYAEARVVLDEARALNASLDDGERNSLLAQSLVSLATADWGLGRRDDARTEITRAIELFSAYHGAEHPNVAIARGRYAAWLAEAGEHDEAWRALEAAERAAIAHVRLISGTLPEREALRYASERPSGVGLALTLALPPPTAAAAGAEPARRALDIVIANRGVVLDELAARRHDVAGASSPAVRERVDAFVRARARLANLVVRGPGMTPPDRFAALLATARTDREQAEQALADVSQPFREARTRNQAGVAEVMAALGPQQAIAAFVRFERPFEDADSAGRAGGPRSGARPNRLAPEYAVFVVTHDAAPQLVRLGAAAEIETLVNAWRAGIDAEIAAGGLAARRLEADYRRAAVALRRRVWDPMAPHLRNVSALFIVPDGALHLVDFATLPSGDTRYLLESAPTLHYLLAERDVIRADEERSGQGLLALGAPDFDVTAPRPRPVDLSVSTASTTQPTNGAPGGVAAPGVAEARRSAGCEAFEKLSFQPLVAAASETRRISELWRVNRTRAATASGGSGDGADTLELSGPLATEGAFKALAPGRRVLHLATHGFFLDRRCGGALVPGPLPGSVPGPVPGLDTRYPTGYRPGGEDSPLLRAGLALAGANRRRNVAETDEDGVLTAEEIAGVDLSGVEWAVLSACDTGVGDWVSGEGVLGLRRAFEIAGARTVIMSLWPVSDAAASRWMAELYRQRFVLDARTLDAARAASLALLREARSRGASTHPARWAGFIAAGDWR
jgi:CHAT domain-containing protein